MPCKTQNYEAKMLFHVALGVTTMNLNSRFIWRVRRIWRTDCETNTANIEAGYLFQFDSLHFSMTLLFFFFLQYLCAVDSCIYRFSHILVIVMNEVQDTSWAFDTKFG